MSSVPSMSEFEFAKFFKGIREKILENPLEFFIKNKKFIDFQPTPAQAVALKIIFGQELDAMTKHDVYEEVTGEKNEFGLTKVEMTEIELYEFMTGYPYTGVEEGRNQINLIVGRRGGKSTISAIIAIFSTFKINWKPFLSKTPFASVLILSHSVDFSKEILDIIKNMIDESEVLARLRHTKAKNTQSTFHLRIPFLKDNGKIEYSRVAIQVGAASKKTTRGKAVCTLLCDEIAFWNLAENAAESDVDILRAVRPALLQFGKHRTIIKLSSPGIKQGALYEEYKRKEELKDKIVQFKAPSWVWNTILPAEDFKDEWKLDPDGFDTEFRANFVDSISNFILPDFVDMCVVKGASFQPPSEDPNVIYSAAIDAAFKSDRFAFSLVGYNGHRFTQHCLKYWEGSKQEPVRAFKVAEYIRNVLRSFNLSEVIADQYAYQPLREIFEQYGIELVENTFSIQYKRKIYFALKRLIHGQNIDLLDDELLKSEIKQLQVEQTPTGQIKIGHPAGGTDDTADSLAVATFAALEKLTGGKLAVGQIASTLDHGIKVDMNGRAFTAPAPSMLSQYQGFQDVHDNSAEWVKDPETKKWKKRSELEEEQSLGGGGPNFIFS